MHYCFRIKKSSVNHHKAGCIMKKITVKVLFVATLLLTLLSATAFAQDKNMLARVAYEEAERAFEAGDISTAYDELKKVDEHLGKVTPKSQFLRVQVWARYAERNGDNYENAIKHCRTYLAMDKTFSLPDEKKLEVTRLLVKLEKDKAVYEKNKKAEAACNEFLQKLEKNLAVRDQGKIALLTPIDFNKDAFVQLKKLDIMTTGNIKWSKKQAYAYQNQYWHKTEVYHASGTIYHMVDSDPYRIKGMSVDVHGWYLFMTGYNTLQEINLLVKGEHEKMDTYISEVSAILGFGPDDTNFKIDDAFAVWLFADYTVQLMKNTLGRVQVQSMSLVITKHNSAGTHKGRAPFTPCAQ